jgi:hypothetical protein
MSADSRIWRLYQLCLRERANFTPANIPGADPVFFQCLTGSFRNDPAYFYAVSAAFAGGKLRH